MAACKEGRKPESVQVQSAVRDWFEWAQKDRIAIAMSAEVVYTVDGEAVALAEMILCPVKDLSLRPQGAGSRGQGERGFPGICTDAGIITN